MAKNYTTSTLIDSVKRRAMLPETNATFKEADFLAFANEEMDIGVVPHIMSFHEDYLMLTTKIPFEMGVNRYQIPARALGNKLREVQYEDTNGTVFEMSRIFIEDLPYFQYGPLGAINGPVKTFYVEGNEIVLMPEVPPTFVGGALRVTFYMRPNELVSENRVAKITGIDFNKGLFTVDQVPDSFNTSPLLDITSCKSPHKLQGFDLQPLDYGSNFNLTVTMGTEQKYDITCLPFSSIVDSSYIRLDHTIDGEEVRNAIWLDKTGTSPAPSLSGVTLTRIDVSGLVTNTQIATALTATLNTISVGNIVATSSGAVVSVSSGGIGVCVGPNYSIYDGNSNFTIIETQKGTNIIPDSTNIGDILSVSEETIIPQIPLELHSMLAQRVAMRCLEALGDQQGLQAAMLKLQEMELKTGSLIDNRVEGSPLKVSPKHSFLRRSRSYLRR